MDDSQSGVTPQRERDGIGARKRKRRNREEEGGDGGGDGGGTPVTVDATADSVPPSKRKKSRKDHGRGKKQASTEDDALIPKKFKAEAHEEILGVSDQSPALPQSSSHSTRKPALHKAKEPRNKETKMAVLERHGEPQPTPGDPTTEPVAIPTHSSEETLQRAHQSLTRKLSKQKRGKRGESGVVSVKEVRRGRRRTKSLGVQGLGLDSDVGSGNVSSWT